MAMELVYNEILGDYVYQAGPMPWSVRAVEPYEDFSLRLTFADGTTRRYDCRELIMRPPFELLQNKDAFMKAQALHGTVDWGNDLDIAPEFLYENSEIVGE